MWCCGARETREPRVTIGRTVGKSETTKNLPAFQDLNGTRVFRNEKFIPLECIEFKQIVIVGIAVFSVGSMLISVFVAYLKYIAILK